MSSRRRRRKNLILNLREFKLKYEFAEVTIVDLNVDPSYQRPETSLVNIIGEAFDPAAFGIVWVGRRADGKLFVVDGQQRTAGAKLAGMTTVPVLIFESRGKQHEAEIYRKLNQHRRQVSRMDIFRSALVEKIGFAVNINAAVKAAGFRVATGKSEQTAKIRWPKIKAIAVLEKAYRRLGGKENGKENLQAALEIIPVCWPEQDEAMRKEFVEGVTEFYWGFGQTLDLDRAGRLLGKKPASKHLLDADDYRAKQQRSGIFLPKATAVYDRLRITYARKVPERSVAWPDGEVEVEDEQAAAV